MAGIAQFINTHGIECIIAFWVFSNFVSTMPSPKSGSWTDSLGYQWAFNGLHGLSGTIGRVLAQYPATQKLTGQTDSRQPDEQQVASNPKQGG